jgi:HlyD family secretion protein
LSQLKAGPKLQDVASARAGLAAAQANLETQRNILSSAKTRADSAVEQAANTLRNAQDSYSALYWKDRQIERRPGDLPQAVKDAEAAAQRAVTNAEEGLRQAEVAAESARLAEQTGVQAAEQQAAGQQAALDKLMAGATPEQIAATESQLAQARSQLDALTNSTTAAQRAQREASVAQAQAALDLAQFNRTQAELKAPFAGLIAEVNIDVGDPSSSAGAAAIRLIDASALTAEVDVSDVDIAGVRVGQPASMFVQSLPQATFTGKVIYIAPAATVNGNVRSYMVRIGIADQTGLLSGMRVRATLTP